MREWMLGEPFMGLVTGVESRSAPRQTASDMLNVQTVDGALGPAYGYRNLQAARASFVANYGMVHLHGYTASNVEAEEYVCVEDIGGTVKAFVRAAADCALGSDITGATGLNASKWRGIAFRQFGYMWNKAETYPVARHAIGDATSWVLLKQPADPTTALTYQLLYRNDGNPGNYASLSWAGTDAADLTVTGSATTTTPPSPGFNDGNGGLRIQHTAALGTSSVKIDLNGLTASIQDWTYNDGFALTLNTGSANNPFTIDPALIQVQFENNDGTPVVLAPTELETYPSTAPKTTAVLLRFLPKNRGDWDNVRWIKITYRVTGASGQVTLNILTISPMFIGCCYPQAKAGGDFSVGYTYYFSGSDFESGVGGIISLGAGLVGTIPVPIQGQPFGSIRGLGVFIKFTMTVSGDANVDNNRLYFFDTRNFPPWTPTWRRIMTQTDATLTYTLKMSWDEMLALTGYAPTPYTFSGVVGIFPYLGGLVWLYKGGKENVRYSRVGDPERQAPILDDPADDEAGATFSLAPNFADEPVGWGAQVDEAIIIPGYQGVYAQTGPRPLDMTPSRRLSGAPGCAGPDAACRWKDENGNQGVAYVDAAGLGVWFVRAYATDPDNWPKAVELTAAIRDQIRAFLIDGQSGLSPAPTLAQVQLIYDQAEDSLYIVLGARLLDLGRPSILDGKRSWHPRRFNLGGANVQIATVAASVKRRIRWVRSDGKTDEFKWNSSTSAYITGANRDGGNAMPSPYWTSQNFSGFNRRLFGCKVFRKTLTDLPTVQAISTRQTGSAIAVASGELQIDFDIFQMGREHKLKITLGENSDPIYGIAVQESSKPIGERGL